jgi:membrane-associated phospholipid phosphatase
MKRLIAASLMAASLSATPAYASNKGWQNASDVGVYSLLAFSIGLPALHKDGKGALQAAGSFAATSLVTEGLKEAFPKWRPDRSDRKSFPSGHTSRSFSAAATIYNREGAKYGIPAFVVASFVGLARVEGKKHYWSDVAAGAAIGTASGFLITHKRPDSSTAFMPWVEHKGAGFTVMKSF